MGIEVKQLVPPLFKEAEVRAAANYIYAIFSNGLESTDRRLAAAIAIIEASKKEGVV